MTDATDWSALLQGTDASRTAATATAGEPASGITVLVPLPDYAIIEVSGPDAGTFLQGQLTCHLPAIDSQHGAPGAQCSIKGRVLATFLIGQTGPDRYWLRLRRELAAETAQQLAKYVVFAKADVALREDVLVLGLHGPSAAGLLPGWSADSGGRHATAERDGGLIYQRDADGQRFECWLATTAMASLLAGTRDQLTLATPDLWTLLDIRAGEAEVDASSRDEYLPQMLNLDYTGAVRFDKGCYTGQEVVARAHYRGQVKRRLHRFSAPSPVAPGPIHDDDNTTVGHALVTAAVDPGGEILAIINEAAASRPLELAGQPLRAESLPYAINETTR